MSETRSPRMAADPPRGDMAGGGRSAARPLRPRLGAWLPRWPVLLSFTLVALALLGAAVLVLNTIQAEQRERARAARTAEVLTVLRDISRDAVNAETGQRGYYITLDKRYLAPFQAASAQHAASLARLRTLVSDTDDRQRELAAEIEQLSAAKFAEVSEVIVQIRQGDLFGAQRRILTDEGQDVMERLRRAIDEMERIERAHLSAATSESLAAEARLVPLMLILLVLISTALGLGLWLAVRNADAEARAAHAGELAEARDRADLLARELNHRVKNLFAVVLAIVQMSGRDQPEAKPLLESISDRIRALLKAQSLTQGESGGGAAELRSLIETVLAPYRSASAASRIDGPPLPLPEPHVVPLGLMLHELVTNAVKYGAWSKPGGEIAIAWTVSDAEPRELQIDWRESCAEPPREVGAKKGFGSMLLDSSARQLGGTVARAHEARGIAVSLRFPLLRGRA